MDKVLENRICLLIKEMTLEEKTGMIHGVRWTDGCAQRVCQ